MISTFGKFTLDAAGPLDLRNNIGIYFTASFLYVSHSVVALSLFTDISLARPMAHVLKLPPIPLPSPQLH